MVLRELSESEWQHSFVSVLKLSGSGSSKADTTRVLGDVKHIMDKTIGRRALRISGPVSAANYWEARTAPLNLTGRFVYIQVRPIGDKVMTFHLDVLDAGGQPERVTFSTLYSAPPSTPTGGGGGFFKRSASGTTTTAAGNRVSTLGGNTKHSNGATGGASSGTTTALEAWKSGGAGAAWAATKGEATAADAAAGAALVKRGGALRYPVSFDTSRSRGWSVVAIDMAAVMREGAERGGGGGGKGYGLLRAVRLGSNMVVRGVYASDCVYSPHTLPKEMAFRIPGGGVDWETAYNWLWLPEVPDENAAPPRDGTRQTTRPAWPPGADSPTSSVAAANAADARERRRMEKRHFFAEPGKVGKLIAQQDSEADKEEEEAAAAAAGAAVTTATTPSRGRSAVPGIRGRAASKARRDSGGVSVGAAFPRTPRRNEDDRRGRSASARRTPLGSPRAPYPGGGGGGVAPQFPRQPIASPARMRPASATATTGVGVGVGGVAAPSPRSRSARSASRPRNGLRVAPSPTNRLRVAPSPTAAGGNGSGRPPLSPRRKGGTPAGTPAGRGRAFFSSHDNGPPDAEVGGGGGGGGGFETVDEGGDWNWTREELEAWPGRGPAPSTPVVSVLPSRGGEEEEGREEEGREAFGRRRGGVASGGGMDMDPPVLSRVLPPGLETSRPDPPEFDPDPALRLERAVCYTGELPSTLAFVGPEAEFMAFPCNNVIVLTDTPVMPEAVLSEHDDGGDGGREGFGVGEEEEVGGRGGIGLLVPEPPPPPQLFLRGHTDTVTHLQLSHAGHLLASAQGDSLGAAGGHGIVRLWDVTSLGRTRGSGGGRGGGGGSGSGGKCAAHFIAHRWGVSSLCFSSDDRLLCTVGGDEHRRTQVIVWDVALLCTARAGTVHGAGSGLAVVARQISDFPITKMLFSPFEKLRLVSCGRENVRFWRVRRRHLPACPAVLNDFARDLECTDLAFQSSCRGIAGVEQEDRANWADGPCVVYVSSRAGTVLQVSYHTRNLLCVLQLHDGPILSLEVNEDYAITASEDKFLRLWPLDFSDFLMEAAHESPVVSVCSSKDGMKLAVGTSAGSIGVLDVMTHGYTTCLRSHRGGVTAAAIDPSEERDEFATVSQDCTLRVWDLVTGVQRYQFSSPADRPTCVAYAPPTATARGEQAPQAAGGGRGGDGDADAPHGGGAEAAGEERHLVAGYVSGTVRVFDVPSTSTLYELQQHRGAVQQVVFTPDGTRVISAGEDGLLCLYDVSQGYHPIRAMACDEPQPGRPISLSVSPGSDRLAVIGTEPSCILLYDLATMVLKGRLGKPGHRGGRLVSGVGGGGGGMLQPWRHRSGSFDGAGAAVVADSGAAAAAAGGGFLHAAFSGDGADLLACTATKFFRFPLGGGDVHAWSALLPCKSGPAMAACNPSTGPGLILVSPAPTASSGDLGWVTGAGGGAGSGGGGKRGAPPRALGVGGSALAPSELFLSQIHRDERSASVVLSAPQAFAAHASPVTVAVFSAGGDRLVTCDGTGVVLLWSNLAAPGPDAWAAPPRPVVAATGGDDGGSLGAGAGGAGGNGKLFGGQHGEGDYLEAEKVEKEGEEETDAAAAAGRAEQEFGQKEKEETLLHLEVPERLTVPEAQAGREAEARAGGGGEVAEAAATVAARARAGAPPGLRPTTSPMEFRQRGGKGRGYVSMVDQTPPPTMQTARRAFATAATEGRAGGAGQRTAPGQLEQAIKALQTVVDDAAAVVGEGENGGGDDGGGGGRGEVKRQPTSDAGLRRYEPAEVARFDDDDDDDDDDDGDSEGGVRDAAERERAAKTRPISPRAPFASPKEYQPLREAAATARAGTGTSAMTCVAWHPASARLIYAEGTYLFAEDLETCRRWALSSADGGGSAGRGVGHISCVAISADGDLVARGTSSRRTGPSRSGGGTDGRASRLSVWLLGRDVMRKPRNLSYGGSSGDGGRRRPSQQADAVVGALEDAEVGGGVVALAFSPSGSDLCSVGEWDGGKCLLKVRPTSGLVDVDSPITRRSSSSPLRPAPPTPSAASEGVVTQISAQTSAICMLPAAAAAQRREAAAASPPAAEDAREPFLFVTGGDEGVALWRRVFDSNARPGTTSSRGSGRIRDGGGGHGRGGVSLLGTSAGWKATALANVGRFVVGADVVAFSSSEGAPGGRVGAGASPTVTAIDVNWLAAGGYEAGMQGLMGDEECTWRVLRGSGGDVAITCLASAGPRRVAVGGSGGKLEVWDVEAVCAGGAGASGDGEASAGLVQRLDLGDALEGASVTDMTWDAGGTDAVLGASTRDGDGDSGRGGGGGIWHLRLPQGAGGEPTLARLWPGGNLKA